MEVRHKIMILCCTLTCMFISYSANAQSLSEKASEAYNKDDFGTALKLYLDAAKEDGTSSELYYNIGNSYYKLDKNGMAILYYERALLLDPNNKDARSNLEFVKSKANLNIDTGATYWKDSLEASVKSMSSSLWGAIAVISFILFIILLVIYIFVDTIILRKIGFFGGGLMLICSIVANICAFYVKSQAEARNQAIVVIPSATLSTSPRQPKDKTEEAFMLNEGVKVEIVDSVTNTVSDKKEKWYDVKADETHRAWINADAIEII